MAAHIIPMRVGEIELLVETSPAPCRDPASPGAEANPADNLADNGAAASFAHAKDAMVEMAVSTVEVIQRASQRGAQPAHVELRFGLKFSPEGDVILSGASEEASLIVKLVYDGQAVAANLRR